MAKEDIDYIEAIAKIVTELDLESVDYNKDGLHIIVNNRAKENIAQPIVPAVVNAPVSVPVSVDSTPLEPTPVKGETIKSPMVGVIYLAPTPNDPDYVKIGDTVKEGDILCLIEAMKTFNQIKAPRGGIIRDILAVSGSAVEFDEPLFVIE